MIRISLFVVSITEIRGGKKKHRRTEKKILLLNYFRDRPLANAAKQFDHSRAPLVLASGFGCGRPRCENNDYEVKEVTRSDKNASGNWSTDYR